MSINFWTLSTIFFFAVSSSFWHLLAIEWYDWLFLGKVHPFNFYVGNSVSIAYYHKNNPDSQSPVWVCATNYNAAVPVYLVYTGYTTTLCLRNAPLKLSSEWTSRFTDYTHILHRVCLLLFGKFSNEKLIRKLSYNINNFGMIGKNGVFIKFLKTKCAQTK